MNETKVRSARLDCVDVLRGIVVALMALDHSRDFFTSLHFAPEDLLHTSAPLFFTRFATHFCAPVFFLLAGMGTYLFLSTGKSIASVSNFLWTRGVWLIVLNFTVMCVGWNFLVPIGVADVLWSLGWSMIIMAGLVHLPVRWVGIVGATIIVTHNLFDGVNADIFGKFAWLWKIVHGFGMIWINSAKSEFLFVLFSLSPWVGVMAVGYALGAVLRRPDWRKLVAIIGATLTIAFIVLRVFHLYGNGAPGKWTNGPIGPWARQANLTLTILAFFNTSKYPASLQFLLMTLGPSLMLLSWLAGIDADRGFTRILRLFGRVPLWFYVLHVYVIHSLALLTAILMHQPYLWLIDGGPMMQAPPPRYGHGLPFIYLMWGTVLVLMYLPCKWFMDYKERHHGVWWLRYV